MVIQVVGVKSKNEQERNVGESSEEQGRKKRQEVSAPPGYRRVWRAGGKLQPFHLVVKVHQEEGDQSKLTRTPYTLFPKEARAIVVYCVCYS